MALLDSIGRILSGGKFVATHTWFSCVHKDDDVEYTIDALYEDLKKTYNNATITKGQSSISLKFTKGNGSATTITIPTASTSTAGVLTTNQYNAILAAVRKTATTTNNTLTFQTLSGVSKGSIILDAASTTQAGLMTAADKEALDNAPKYIDISEYKSSGKVLPTLNAVFHHNGLFVDYRTFFSDKEYHIFRVPFSDTEGGNRYLYILYDDTLKYSASVWDTSLRQQTMWIARAFGDADATTEYSGLMSADDKQKLDKCDYFVGDEPFSFNSEGDYAELEVKMNGKNYSAYLPMANAEEDISGIIKPSDKKKLDSINDYDEQIRRNGIRMFLAPGFSQYYKFHTSDTERLNVYVIDKEDGAEFQMYSTSPDGFTSIERNDLVKGMNNAGRLGNELKQDFEFCAADGFIDCIVFIK